jgi:hypothetical protein
MAWEHVVQLYLNDAFLIKSLTPFILAGLEEKATVIAVVTEKHREDLRRVSRSAHDPVSEETLVFRDACDLLSAFMIDGWPDQARFLSEIGHSVDTATRPGSVRIFQEMGTVLWAQGNTRAALRVEELWNEIAPLHAFSLLCAYPTSAYSAENDDDSFLPVCLTHTHVRTSRSFIPLAKLKIAREVPTASRYERTPSCLTQTRGEGKARSATSIRPTSLLAPQGRACKACLLS